LGQALSLRLAADHGLNGLAHRLILPVEPPF